MVATAMLTTGACSGSGPAISGFGSYAGVLGCAELVAWGTVTGSEPGTEGLQVTFDVQEWVHPESGGAAVTFVADDPAREVAAPTWGRSDETVLVIVSDIGPAERLGTEEGARAVAQWRDAGSTRTPAEQCDNA